MAEVGSRHPRPVTLSHGDILSLNDAARLANVSQGTVVRWARRYGIGRQLSAGSQWRISAIALRMVAAADSEALEAFRDGQMESPLVAPYGDGRAAA